jgi:diadenosine tetraphosphate (Ap4A) HIT family hydrolase
VPECHVCAIEAADDSQRELYVDEHWRASSATDAPGWVMLLNRRHNPGWLWDLTDDEASSYGLHLRAIAKAITEVCGAERVYLIALGENTLHYHCLLIPRFADTPAEMRGAALLGHAASLANPTRALEVTAELRDHLAAAGARNGG